MVVNEMSMARITGGLTTDLDASIVIDLHLSFLHLLYIENLVNICYYIKDETLVFSASIGWLEMRDSDPEATHREDVRRNEEALQRMKSKVMAAECERLLLQGHGQQSSECTLGGPSSQPNQQQDSTFQPGSWPGEQQHLQYLMPRPDLQPGEQQQSADLTFELDPFSEMLQMEAFNSEAVYEVDMSTEEVLLQMETEVNDASGQQDSGDSLLGPSAPHGEPQHSATSSSQPGSSSGEQQHAECLMPGTPSSKSGDCPHSASKTDELPSSSEPGRSSQSGQQQHLVHLEPGPSSQSGQQQPLPHSSSAGEQQHLDPAAAGSSLPTEQQNSVLSWSGDFPKDFWPT
ncbi:putative protein piccolo-like [Cocos nucifera]|nr:putative protein piccolo-like [Cocos nucifera]